MKYRIREYLLTWLALIVLIISVTFLLLVSFSNFFIPQLKFVFSISAWIIAIISAILNFLYASRWSLLKHKANAEVGSEKPDLTKKTILEKSELDILDLQGVAKKIARRISPGNDPEKWGKQLLSLLASEIEIMAAVIYFKEKDNTFKSRATFAYPHSTEPYSFIEGEGLTGQAVKNRQIIVYRSLPENYANVFSGLGTGKPSYLAIIPLLINDKPFAVIELAGFRHADENLEQLFQIIAREISEKINESPKEK